MVSFLIGGLITMLIMRMLAEMAVAQPVVGSFYIYARQALGRRGGFVTGWMYWYFFVVVVAVETVAGGRIVHLWLPQVPLWILSLGLLLALTATNLVSAKSFGEFGIGSPRSRSLPSWFSGVGLLWITGLWPESTPGLSNLVDHGGFAPLGWECCVGRCGAVRLLSIPARRS